MSSHVSVVTFKFDKFESLPSDPGSRTLSSWVTDADNNKWRLLLYQGGEIDEPTENNEPATEGEDEEQPMSIYIFNGGPTDLDVDLSFIIRNRKGSSFRENEESILTTTIKVRGVEKIDDLMTRSEVLDEANGILVDGALHVECVIQIWHKFNVHHEHFYFPPNPPAIDMLRFFTSQSDASFVVGHEYEVFHLHKHILSARAPILSDMCEGGNKDKPILLPNISPEIFGIVVRYIYGGGLLKDVDIEEMGKEIIDAADYCGIEGLKMVAENILVASRYIRITNVIDWLLFADTKTCPLLKEYAMAYIAARPGDVLESESYGMLSPELKDEIILFMHQKYNSSVDNGIRSLTVDELRRKLHEKCLDVYGSKETLMSRLEESKKRKRNEE